MAQIFQPSTNTVSKVTIFGGIILVASLAFAWDRINRSAYFTQADVVRDQPVPFSHEHHSRGLGIDCRYCHTTVETQASAGMPPTYTCMSCHSQIWADSPVLAPVRDSLRDDKPLAWSRLHDLPDFAYFHHGIHVQKGIG